MRPFALEIAKLYGWHDGKSINIAEPSNAHVVRHEEVHADIFLNTPDGQFLGFCMQFANDGADRKCARLRRKAIAVHIERARWAHECVATFLGVNLCFDEEDAVRAREELPEEYQHYYDVFDKLTQGVFQSRFLRVGLGVAIMHAVFSSSSILSWTQTQFNYDALLRNPPDDRLRTFIDWWASVGAQQVQAALHTTVLPDLSGFLRPDTTTEVVVTLQDIDDDLFLFSSEALGDAVDKWLLTTLAKAFERYAPIEILNVEEWRQALEDLRVFASANGHVLEIHTDPVNSKPNLGLDAVHRAISAADTLTHVTPTLRSGDAPHFEEVDGQVLLALLEDGQHIVNLIFDQDGVSCGPCIVDVARVVGPDKGIFDRTLMINPDEALAALEKHADRVFRKVAALMSGCVVLPRETTELDASIATSDQTAATIQDKTSDHPTRDEGIEAWEILQDSCLEYLNGEVYAFIDEHKDDYRFAFQPFEATSQPEMLAFWGISETCFPHWVLKCLPTKSGKTLAGHLDRRGDINLVIELAPPAVQAAIRLTSCYWSVL